VILIVIRGSVGLPKSGNPTYAAWCNINNIKQSLQGKYYQAEFGNKTNITLDLSRNLLIVITDVSDFGTMLLEFIHEHRQYF